MTAEGPSKPKELSPSVIERTASTAIGPVLKISGAISGFVAISYLIGLANVKAYYVTIGAPWVVDLLSYSQIAKAGFVVTSGVVVMAFASLVDLARTGKDPKSVERWARYTALVAMAPAIVSLLPRSAISPAVANICTLVMGFLLTLSAAFTLAELVARFRISNYKWTAHQLLLVFIIQAIVLSSAPALNGMATANLQMEGDTLPIVTGPGLEDGEPWRLVKSLDSGLLVVAPSSTSDRHDRVFRVLPPTSQITISSTSRRGT